CDGVDVAALALARGGGAHLGAAVGKGPDACPALVAASSAVPTVGAGNGHPHRSARLWVVGADPPPGAPCGGVCLVFGCAVAVGLWGGGAQPRVPAPPFAFP